MTDDPGLSVGWLLAWLRLAARRVAERRDELTALDAAIGDGDHGINLDRGMAAILARLERGELPVDAPGPLVSAVGRTLMSTVGGASGALYGRAFMRAGERLGAGRPGDGEEDGRLEAVDAMDAAISAIAALGRSRPGEKTMLDALVPAAAACRAALESGSSLAAATGSAAGAAEAGARATIPMLATKGRASYLGERSIGHLDPGATSAALLVRALADVLAEG